MSPSIDDTNEKAQVTEAAEALYQESKKKAEEIYEENLAKINEIEEYIKAYSDKLILKVRENPLSSILIAAGAGILLSKILK